MARHGEAYYVVHPRRHDQDYTSCDLAHVAVDVVRTVRDCGWPVMVQMIRHVGDESLSICLGDHDNLAKLSDAVDQQNASAFFDRCHKILHGKPAGR